MKKYKIVFTLESCSVIYFGNFPSIDAVNRYVRRRLERDYPAAVVSIECLGDAE